MIAWRVYRERLLEALDRANPQPDLTWDRYWRIDPDHWLHACPACRSPLPQYLSIRLHGERPRADLRCSAGCPQLELDLWATRAVLGGDTRPHQRFTQYWTSGEAT